MTTSSNICLYVYDIFGPTFVWIWSYSLAKTGSLHPPLLSYVPAFDLSTRARNGVPPAAAART